MGFLPSSNRKEEGNLNIISSHNSFIWSLILYSNPFINENFLTIEYTILKFCFGSSQQSLLQEVFFFCTLWIIWKTRHDTNDWQSNSEIQPFQDTQIIFHQHKHLQFLWDFQLKLSNLSFHYFKWTGGFFPKQFLNRILNFSSLCACTTLSNKMIHLAIASRRKR